MGVLTPIPDDPNAGPVGNLLKQGELGSRALTGGLLKTPEMVPGIASLLGAGEDWALNKLGLSGLKVIPDTIVKGLNTASKYYDDAVNSIVYSNQQEPNTLTAKVGEGAGGLIAFPGGAESKIMEAPSILGKGWRALSHAVNPSSVAGKAALGGGIAGGIAALDPGQAQATQPTAPDLVTDTGTPQVSPLGPGWKPLKPVAAAQPVATDPLGAGWHSLSTEPIHPAVAEKAQHEQDDDAWGWIVGTGALAGAVGVGLLTRGKGVKSALELSREAAPSIFGRAAEEASPEVGWRTKVAQGQIDGGAAARDTMMKADPNLGQDFSDRMTLATPTALAEKTKTALQEGTIASTNIKMRTPLADIANKLAGMAKADPTVVQKLNKYAYSLDALHGAGLPPGGGQRLVRLYDGWKNDVPYAANLPDEAAQRAAVKAHLQDFVDGIEQPRLPNGQPNPNYNADIVRLQMALKQNYADVAKHLFKAGVIDRPTYLDWSTRDYMPMQARLDQGTLWNRFWKSFTLPEKEIEPRDEWSSLMERMNNDGERILSPIDAQEQYIRQAIRYVEQNHLKRMYVQAMRAQPAGSNLRKLVSDVTNTAGVKNMISYKQGGITKNVQIHDPYVYNALKFNPGGQVLPTMFNWTRQMLQKTTTGILAPAFAPVGLTYDMWGIGALGNKVGPLGLAKIPYWTVRGFGKGLGARMAGGMSQSLRAAVLADGTLPKLLGPQVTNTLINRGGQIWRQSLLYKAQKVGAMGSARAMDDAAIGKRLTFMNSVAPHYTNANPFMRNLSGLGRMYTGLFQAVQESARLGYFEHLAGQQPLLKDLIKAGAETRRVTGDFGQAGASKFAHGMSEMFPYYNISMQSMARIAHQFRTKPFQTLTQVGLGLAMPSIASTVYASMMGKQYRDYYWKRLSSADRSSVMYLPVPGMPPQRGIFIPVMPEWRPFHAMLANLMDGIFGFSSNTIDRPENKGFDNGLDSMFNYRMYQDIGAGLSSGVSTISMPPAANAALAAMGQRNVGDMFTSFFPKLSPIHPDDLSALDPDSSTRGVWMPQKAEQIIGALAGSVGQTFLHSVVAAQQAWNGKRSIPKAVGETAALDMTRNIPLSTTMWKLDRRIGANTPMDNYAMDTIQSMKKLANGARTDISNSGIGTRGLSFTTLSNEDQFNTGLPDDLSRFKDPAVGEIVARAGFYMRMWQRTYGNEMNATQKKIEDVRSSTKLSPTQQRSSLNQLYAKMQDLHKEGLSDIQDTFIKPLRQEYGRAIDIGKITPDTVITDFPLLNAPSP